MAFPTSSRGSREADEDPDPGSAALILQKYGARFVVPGDLERWTYPAENDFSSLPFLLAAFPGQTSIYRVLSAP